MIGFLDGAVAARLPDGCFLDVQGVGYRLTCSTTTAAALPQEGQPCRLWTYLHVREDALSLFGFSTVAEQSMFEALLGVAGVGPKVALQVCSSFSFDSFRRALITGDVDAIAAVPGIGKKTAQRIVIDLKERMALPQLGATAPGEPMVMAAARSALANLGYSPAEVRSALGRIEPDPDQTVESIVRSALRVLS